MGAAPFRRFFIALLSICLLSAQAHAQPQPLTQAENAFALDLYGKLRQQPGNLFFSPYSIATAIGMAYAGAKGGTAAEIANVLHLDLLRQPGADLPTAFLQAARQQQNLAAQTAGFEFTTANALWGAENYPFNPPYIASIETDFGGHPEAVDFGDEPATRAKINAWVAAQTHGKIQNLIGPGILSAQTRLVLTNAIYFKAGWASPFDKTATDQQPFHVSAADTVSAAMMHRTGYFTLTQAPNARILSLSYRDDAASMVIILPDHGDGLAAVEAALTPQNLDSWLAQGQPVNVALALPKFRNAGALDLGDVLMALGMRRAFMPGQADLTGIASDSKHRLYIGGVIHQAFISVDEQGTEAAAATAIGIGMTAIMQAPPPIPFIADHPFIYLIRDDQSGRILFMGRVTDPTRPGR